MRAGRLKVSLKSVAMVLNVERDNSHIAKTHCHQGRGGYFVTRYSGKCHQDYLSPPAPPFSSQMKTADLECEYKGHKFLNTAIGRGSNFIFYRDGVRGTRS